MSHTHDEEVLTIHEVRTHLLTEAFGEKQVPAFQEILVRLTKASFEAYAFKVKATAPVYEAQSKLVSKIEGFWLKSMTNCRPIAEGMIDAVDRDALAALTDVSIKHKEDPREFDITFTFSKNAFFSNTTLTKSYTVVAPADSVSLPAGPYDLEADLFHKKSEPIKWTDAAHDLTKKAPRVNIAELEEYDEFSGMGSFFNIFAEEGEDESASGENFLEWYSHAIEYAAGLAALEDSDGEDEEEDEDNFGEVDLESEEEEEKPKKKKAKTAK